MTRSGTRCALLAMTVWVSAACAQILGVDPQFVDGGTDAAEAGSHDGSVDRDAFATRGDSQTSRDVGRNVDRNVDAAPDVLSPATCTPLLEGDILLCAPRHGVEAGLDGSAPFLSGAYSWDKGNAPFPPPTNVPATQRATVYASWDESYLYLSATMTDPNAITIPGSNFTAPSIELAAFSGSPDLGWAQAECVDFFVGYDNNFFGPARYDTNGTGILHSASGTATSFRVTAAVPAALLGSLSPGKTLAFSANANSYETAVDGGGQDAVMWAFFATRTCPDEVDGAFGCGGGDEPYEPVVWARLNLE